MTLFSWIKKKDKEQIDGKISNEIQMLFARFLFDSEPQIDDKLIEEYLSKDFNNYECPKDDLKDNSRQYFFNDFLVEYQEGKIPAQCTIFKPETNEHISKNLDLAYRQLWHWPEAKEKTKYIKYELVLTDLMSRPLDYKIRLDIFQKFVCSVAKALEPRAIYFPTSEKIVEPSVYIENIWNVDKDKLYGFLNVRLFNIEGSGLLMDTVGLHSFGLPDFQFQFTDYEPGQVAGLLNSYANYIYDYGSVIKNGNTVEGFETGAKWKCIYDSSLLEPIRNILRIEEK